MSTHDQPQHDTTAESPQELLDRWREFVEGCEQGYEFNVMEYHTDLAIRDRIEVLLRASEGPDATWAAGVAELDERFRALLQPGVQVGPEDDPWWHRGVPRYAGYALSDGLREWFGVEVEARG